MRSIVFAVTLSMACRREAPIELSSLGSTTKTEDVKAPSADTSTRTTKSADEKAVLIQEPTGEKCSAKCTRNSKDIWSASSCLGSSDDYVFLSDDCSSTIVLAKFPPTTKDWSSTEVVFIYKNGKLVKTYPGGPMLSKAEVETRDNHFTWLKGEPRYLQNGVGISFVVRNGRLTRLPFEDGTKVNEETYVNNRETPREAPKAPPRPVETYVEPEENETASIPGAAEGTRVPDPQNPTRYVMRLCKGRRGCVDIPLQAPPTVKPGADGIRACRTQGEACGTGADCCSGTCNGVKCQ